MAKQEKTNLQYDKKTKSEDVKEVERARLEKWRPGRRNFP